MRTIHQLRAEGSVMTRLCVVPPPARSIAVTLLFAGAFSLFPASPAAAAGAACAADPRSGAPVPDTAPGICLAPAGDSLRLVQVTSDGVLILALAPDIHTRTIALREGSRALQWKDRPALIVFCPSEGDSERTDGIPASCLPDFELLTTGPAALLGAGSILEGSVIPGADGLSAPALLRVSGFLRDSAGEPYSLRSTLALRESGPGLAEPERVSLQSLTLRDLRLEPGAPPVRLDDLLSSFPSATSGEFEGPERQLLERVRAKEAVAPAALSPANPSSPAPIVPQLCLLTDPFTNECLSDKIDSVQSTLNGVDSTVANVKGTVNRLESDLVDRLPEVRNLANLADATQVTGLFRQVNDEVQGLLDTAGALQAGFDTWRGQPCDTDSPTECGQFKRDLLSLISDMEAVAEFVKSTSCLDVPFVEDRGLEPGMLRDLLDKTPPVALIAVRNILDRVAPATADPAFSSGIQSWSTMFSDLLAAVPQSLRDEISAACGEDPLHEKAGDPIQCQILRPPAVEKALIAAQVIGKIVERLSKTEESVYTPDDFELTIEAVVAAGGGAGAQVPNVLKATLSVQSNLAENVGEDKAKSVFEKLKDLREKCLDRDKDIEEDLRECTPRMSYVLSYRPDGIPNLVPYTRPTFQEAVDQLDRHIEHLSQCRLGGGCKGPSISAAQKNLAQARKKANSRKGFNYLCDAYCELSEGGMCSRAKSK